MKTKEEQRYELVKEWMPSVLNAFVSTGEPLDGREVVDQTIMMANYAMGKLSELAPKKKAKITSPEKPFLERQEDFKKEVDRFYQEYPKKMLEGFYCYWSEKVQGEEKMKWEKKDTWETSKRLATWASNNGIERAEVKKEDNEYIRFKKRYEK